MGYYYSSPGMGAYPSAPMDSYQLAVNPFRVATRAPYPPVMNLFGPAQPVHPDSSAMEPPPELGAAPQYPQPEAWAMEPPNAPLSPGGQAAVEGTWGNWNPGQRADQIRLGGGTDRNPMGAYLSPNTQEDVARNAEAEAWVRQNTPIGRERVVRDIIGEQGHDPMSPFRGAPYTGGSGAAPHRAYAQGGYQHEFGEDFRAGGALGGYQPPPPPRGVAHGMSFDQWKTARAAAESTAAAGGRPSPYSRTEKFSASGTPEEIAARRQAHAAYMASRNPRPWIPDIQDRQKLVGYNARVRTQERRDRMAGLGPYQGYSYYPPAAVSAPAPPAPAAAGPTTPLSRVYPAPEAQDVIPGRNRIWTS